ncbi:MAG: PQQ-binding-like beta-propeller repeat protein [Anaerolineales bacterium]
MTSAHPPSWRRHARWLAILLIPLLLTACSGSRTPSSSWPGVVVKDGVAYLSFNDSIYAIQASDGSEVWRYTPAGDMATSFYAPVAIDDQGVIYAGSYDGGVFALNADDGNLVWQQDLSSGRIIGGPAVAGDLLLIPSSDRNLYAVQKAGGQLVWSFTSDRPLWATPLVENERVYLAALDHNVYELNLRDGSVLWSRELGGAIADQPASFDGLLISGTFGDKLNAMDESTGNIVWTVPTGDWVWGNPTVGDGVAYFGDVSGGYYAVDQQGGIVWKSSFEGSIAASPAYDQGHLFFVTEASSVFAREADDNTPMWQQTLTGRLLADPVVTDGLVLVSALDGDNVLTALDAESGAIRWTYQPAKE